jgi:hypothetical protein
VTGSPAGHNNKCFSRKFLPSVALFVSCWPSGDEESLGSALVAGLSFGGFVLEAFGGGILYLEYVFAGREDELRGLG